MRLDRWFGTHFPQVSFGTLQKLIRTGQVRVDSGRVKTNTRLAAGQLVRIPPVDAAVARAEIKTNDADVNFLRDLILYEDDDLFVFNKPHGLASQGGSGTKRHLDGLLKSLTNKKGDAPRLVHRLDRDTSGCLVVAKTRAVAAHFGEVFKTRAARKIYWALTVGIPQPRQGRISCFLLKQAGIEGEQMVVVPDGTPDAVHSVSYYSTTDTAARRFAWVTLKPMTGRTHQLRVHMAELGTPIFGDPRYFNIENWEAPEGTGQRPASTCAPHHPTAALGQDPRCLGAAAGTYAGVVRRPGLRCRSLRRARHRPGGLMRLVIFDMDGTLIDSVAVIVETLTAAFEAAGQPVPPQAAMRAISGLTARVALEQLAPHANAEEIERIVQSYRTEYGRRAGATREPLFVGALEVLERLRHRPDTTLAVATGKGYSGATALLDAHGIAEWFHSIETPTHNRGKPDPQMIETAMAKASASLAQTVMIGDTTHDMHMAKAAGVAAIGVAWGYHATLDLTAAGADMVVERFEDLEPAIDRMLS